MSAQSRHREYAIWGGCILKEESLGKTPMAYTFWWYPGRRIPLSIQYFGYRSSVLDVHRSISPLIVADDILHLRLLRLMGIRTRNT